MGLTKKTARVGGVFAEKLVNFHHCDVKKCHMEKKRGGLQS